MTKPVISSKVAATTMSSSPSLDLSWQERRDLFRAHLRKNPLAHISEEEMDIHFSAMPSHYWERVTEPDLLWGLETINGFLQLVATPNVPPTKPFVSWQQSPQRGQTRVMLCTWDRHGLLSKAAAAFSLVRLNILKADVFTRADNVVLDMFSVTDSDGRGAATLPRLEEMSFVLEGALSEPPRFVSVWACSRHKFLAPPSKLPPRIELDTESSPNATILRVEAGDRLGLLYDILHTLAESGFEIIESEIDTAGALAQDTIYFTDAEGQKVSDKRRLEDLRHKLAAAITIA